MRTTAYSTLALLALASPGRGDEVYTIKIKRYQSPGTTVAVRDTEKESGSMKFVDADGKVLHEVKRDGKENVSRTTVLEAGPDGRPVKYLRAHETATEAEDGKTKAKSYQGRTLLYERAKDGKDGSA